MALLCGYPCQTIPHGDSKHRRGTDPTRETPRLTIPHGDSKLGTVLPARRPERNLTIPHGDSKPAKILEQLAAFLNSLSPMGIQNSSLEAMAFLRGKSLTIPHGDSKRLVSWVGTRLPASHYPPWGFKTAHHRPPLAGALRLTIPHGDSKRGGLHRSPAGAVGSLSPMGIQNVGPARSEGTRSRAHYPPWGFKTIACTVALGLHFPISLSPMGIQNQGFLLEVPPG